LPMLTYFDHVVLRIEYDGKIQYADLLLKNYKLGEVPLPWSGANGLLLKPGGSSFVALPIAEKGLATSYIYHKVSLDGDGSASGVVSVTFNRDATGWLRKSLKGMSKSDQERWLSAFATTRLRGGIISENSILNLDKAYTNLKVVIRYEQKNWADSVDNMMVFGLGTLDRPPSFTSQTRKNAILFKRNILFEIENEYLIPEGYQIVRLPENFDVETDFAFFKRSYEVAKGSILEKISQGQKRSNISQKRYQEIRDYFDNLVASTKNRIAIRKGS